MLERLIINGIDVTDYRTHPRILELRFVETYDSWEKEFGDRADGILSGLADAFQCDISKLRAVANQASAIRKMNKSDPLRRVQEMIFMGEVWREKRYSVAKRYLSLSARTLYGQSRYIPKHYVTQEWLGKLDAEVVACGLRQYSVEVDRFLVSLDAFRKVI